MAIHNSFVEERHHLQIYDKMSKPNIVHRRVASLTQRKNKNAVKTLLCFESACMTQLSFNPSSSKLLQAHGSATALVPNDYRAWTITELLCCCNV